jgi:hypothetical protein
VDAVDRRVEVSGSAERRLEKLSTRAVAQIVAERNLRSARSADGGRAALAAQIAGLWPDNLRHGLGGSVETPEVSDRSCGHYAAVERPNRS